MNERIRKLAEQAGIIPGIMGLNRFTHFDPEKFALLIVEECAKIIEAQDCDPSFKNRLSWAMKDKFGVDIK